MRVAALQRSGRRFRQADIRRVKIERVHRAIAALGDLRIPGGRNLVDAVRAMHDPCELGAEQQQRSRDELREFRARHPHELPRRAGRVRQRDKEVDRRSYAPLAPRRLSMTKLWMTRRRKVESDPTVCETT